MSGCTSCGCYARGCQDTAYSTYSYNILHSQARDIASDYPDSEDRVLEELEHALRHQKRWQDWPDGDDHLIRGED